MYFNVADKYNCVKHNLVSVNNIYVLLVIIPSILWIYEYKYVNTIYYNIYHIILFYINIPTK